MRIVIYLAGGCFWGIQGYFDLLKGVVSSQVGYANSKIENPSYELVCSGITDAVEVVKITYEDEVLSLNEILQRFFDIINPFALNYQGNDFGTQYRSGIYAKDSKILEKVRSFIQNLQKNFSQEIVTEVMELKNFYPAESYHQKYLAKNPNGYCHIDLSKALQDNYIP